MATLLGQLLFKITGDTKSLDASLSSTEKKAIQLSKNLKKAGDDIAKIGKKMTTFVTLPILGIGAAFAKAASDAEEVNSKFNVVYKDQAEEVRKWAKEFSQATGRATVDNIKFLASVQDLFVPLGIARDEAADLSKSVVTLATDVSSFNNLPTADVLRDIQSALVGNHETVRKYGVVLSEVTINQELLNMGVKDGYQEATAAEKAIARYNLILAGTSDAQGDAIRTAGSFANRFRALQSSIKDLAEGFGNLLLPALQKLVESVTESIKFIDGLDDSQKKLIITVGLLAAGLGPLLIVVGKLVTLFATLSGPAGWIALAAVAVVALTTAIWKNVKASKEEKELDKDIIALKEELTKTRGDERFEILQTLLAKKKEKLENLKAIKAEIEERMKVTASILGESEAERAHRIELGAVNDKLKEAQSETALLAAEVRALAQQRKLEEDAIKGETDAGEDEIDILEDEADKLGVLSDAYKDAAAGRAAYNEISIVSRLTEEDLYIAYQATAAAIKQVKDAQFNLAESFAAMQMTGRAWSDFLANTMVTAYGDAFMAIGAALVDAEDGWEAFKDAAKDAVAAILEMLGKQLFVAALSATVPLPLFFNPIGAGGAFAASAAAFIAAGVIRTLHAGGDFIVPPGYPNDSYPIAVESGERVQVTSKKQAGQGGGGGPTSGDVYLDGDKVGRWIEQQTRNRQLKIDSGALV